MLPGLHFMSKGTLLPILIGACAMSLPAQITSDQFHKLLTTKAAFESADLAALKNGETVVKFLPVSDRRQVAMCGVVRVRNAHEISMTAFRDSLTQKDNKSRLASGEFHTPPGIGDLQSLKLRDGDVEDLRKCEVGKCNLKLSAALMSRMKAEVDWQAPNHASQAARVYQQMLVDYVDDYQKRGDLALMQYDSRKIPVSLADEYRKSLDKSLFINEFAPDFVTYLRNFPGSGLAGVENKITWSNITFGLDPVLAITHEMNDSRDTAEDSIYLVAAKQIYSSRYLDTSLAFTMLVNIPEIDSAETYLIFTDLSRSNVLDGPFSDIKRSLVETEAKNRVSDMLNRAKARMETNLTSPRQATPEPGETGLAARIWKIGQHRMVRLFLVFLLGVIIFVLYRDWKNSKGGGKG